MAHEGQAITLNEAAHKSFMGYLDNTRHSARDKAIYLLTYRAGMRIGTVAQLELSDILTVSTKSTSTKPTSTKPTSTKSTIIKLKEVVIMRKAITKGGKTVTAFINHPELVEALQAWLEERKGNCRKTLFYSQKGAPFTPNNLSRVMLRHYEGAGYEGSSSHSGRRAFASNCLKGGMDIVALSKVMSHASINTTMRYVHHDESELLGLIANV
jgi:integrase/recombinase XerD